MINVLEFVGLLAFTLIFMRALERFRQSKQVMQPTRFHHVRRSPRYPVHCPVTYRINDAEGKGVVLNMSREGWRVRGSRSVSKGTEMSLAITVPSLAGPIPILRALVRWSDGMEFGISLMALDPVPATQLAEFFHTIESDSSKREPSMASVS